MNKGLLKVPSAISALTCCTHESWNRNQHHTKAHPGLNGIHGQHDGWINQGQQKAFPLHCRNLNKTYFTSYNYLSSIYFTVHKLLSLFCSHFIDACCHNFMTCTNWVDFTLITNSSFTGQSTFLWVLCFILLLQCLRNRSKKHKVFTEHFQWLQLFLLLFCIHAEHAML